MWFLKKKDFAPIRLSNTLSGAKEEFRKKGDGPVLMYSCGPTVYGPQHIGNMRAAVFADTAARAFKTAGYKVKQVINITDVGHMVGDGDEGEDKMAVGAQREKTTPEAIAERYATLYLSDIASLNIDTNDIRFPRATEYIKEQIEMIKTLERKGLAYTLPDGVYFDTKHFPDYGELGNVKQVKLQAGARVAVGEKKNEHDFVLWRTAKPNDLQQWDSPWGKGNPGWSIECSAMATALLGPMIDLHTGGQEHINVHHNNEIAQSEGASGQKPFSRYWLHNAHLTIGGEKISKSLGNTYTIADITERNIHPLALRYLFLQAHYRSPLAFSWESLQASEEALKRLWKTAKTIRRDAHGKGAPSDEAVAIGAALQDDLGTPQALAFLFEALSKGLSAQKKWGVIEAADAALGLSLTNPPELHKEAATLPDNIQTLITLRDTARQDKDYAKSDELREKLEEKGYLVIDTPHGTQVERR